MHGIEKLQKKVIGENQVSGKKHCGENDRDIYTTVVSFTEDDGDEEEETQYYMSPLAESQFGTNDLIVLLKMTMRSMTKICRPVQAGAKYMLRIKHYNIFLM